MSTETSSACIEPVRTGMRKRIAKSSGDPDDESQQWLDLPTLAKAEISSECDSAPVEAALTGAGSGWRAAEPGKQFIRLLFDKPQQLKRILLEFIEMEATRTQEFTLRWSKHGRSPQEIVRQQWNFSPV